MDRDNRRGNRSRSRKRDERYRGNDDGSRKQKEDKFMGSLSEGQKAEEKGSSSESELGDIKLDDEDDEEKIIEMRRKKREELVKVGDVSLLHRFYTMTHKLTCFLPFRNSRLKVKQ